MSFGEASGFVAGSHGAEGRDRRVDTHAHPHATRERKTKHVQASVGTVYPVKMGATKPNMATHAVAVKNLVFDAGKKNPTAPTTEKNRDDEKNAKDKKKKRTNAPRPPVVEAKKDTRAHSRMVLLRKTQCRWKTFEPRNRDMYTQTKGRVIVLPEQPALEDEGTQTKGFAKENMGVHTPRTEGGKDVVSAILEDDRIGPQSLADWLASDPPESDGGGLSRDDLKDWMEEYGDHRDLDEAFEPVQQPPRFPPASPDLHLDHEDLNEVRAPGLGKAPSPNHDALLSVQSDPLNESSDLADADGEAPSPNTATDDRQRPSSPMAQACNLSETGASGAKGLQEESKSQDTIGQVPNTVPAVHETAPSPDKRKSVEENAPPRSNADTSSTSVVPDVKQSAVHIDLDRDVDAHTLQPETVTGSDSKTSIVASDSTGIVPSSSRVPVDDLGRSIDQEPHPPTFQVAENSDPSAPTGLRDVVETVRLPAGMVNPSDSPTLLGPSSALPDGKDGSASSTMSSSPSIGLVQDQSSHDNSDVAVVEVDESSSIALSPSPSLDGSAWGLDPGLEPPTLHVPSPTIVGIDVSTSKPLSEELRSDL